MVETVTQPALQQAGRPLSLVPVGLKEAALDSPTFRATAVHFSDQVEIIERWLEAYIRSTAKLVNDVTSLEETVNTFLTRCMPPANVSEAVLDHDYTLLAMKRFGEGSREWWSQVIGGMKRMDATILEPIRSFMSTELRNFKDARRYLELSQKTFDNTLARYLGQSKTKEPSALREDAFQVHESRKAYLKASLDFSILAPQLRFTIDRLLVRVSSDQWREMKKSSQLASNGFLKWNLEMDRVRGWSRELEHGESVFRRELQLARKEIAETASVASRPTRELEDYGLSTVAYLGSKGSGLLLPIQNKLRRERSGKQGWLFLRTTSGKPARTVWVRRWFYVKNGIFGWLVQGSTSGGVEESEKIGVLLCNIKPAVQEDRRFCFEVKTKNSTLLVQAETQTEVMEWLEAFEVAKTKALEASEKDSFSSPGLDPAFAITPSSIPEFAAKVSEGLAPLGSDDALIPAVEKVHTLPLSIIEGGHLSSALSSFEPSTPSPKRLPTTREEGESSRDHATRIIQKLDLHRKAIGGSLMEGVQPGATAAAGGIASLISASHNILPVYATPAITQMGPVNPGRPTPLSLSLSKETPSSTLAPSTLAHPPAPTNLSKTAVIVSGERGVDVCRSDATGGMPSGIMANLWGSTNWAYINRLESDGKQPISGATSIPASPRLPATNSENAQKADDGVSSAIPLLTTVPTDPTLTPAPGTPVHRKSASADADAVRLLKKPKPESYPANYPIELKTQEAQFRMFFPNVSRKDKLVLVFRATWNPNEQQEFPGRCYVTQKDMFFYSHHLGLVLTSGVSLESIEEVTAAPGKDCDFIFLHLKDKSEAAAYTRITIKTFLEPLRLLQDRLNFLIENLYRDPPLTLEEAVNELIQLEHEDPERSPSMESWEDVSMNTPIDDGTSAGRSVVRRDRDLRASIHVERGVRFGRSGKEVAKFQLPSHPVVYEPQDMDRKAVEKQFDISPKALFHVMFGDKSAVFQLLYHERRARKIVQGPWIHLDQGLMKREFSFQIDYADMFGRQRQVAVVDNQTVDVFNDHVCYVITDSKTPWHLPHRQDFMLVTKIIITHVSKSKCKLAIYTKVQWSKKPAFSQGLVERQALDDLSLDSLDLADLVGDQVRKLGPQSKTKKAIQIFGHVGLQTTASLFSTADGVNSKRPTIKQRTLTSMVLETTSSFAESVASSLMMWTFAVIKGIWNVTSAHSIILSLLALSVLANLVFTGKDTSVWWTERSAANFMARIGVGPNLMMSKAVYLKDLDDILTPSQLLNQPESQCFSTFRTIANSTDMDSSFHSAGSALSSTSTRSTARRLRRTRQNLGSYRHDLIVAMRVVNNVEREMLRAEWENWLLDENARCKQAQTILGEQGVAKKSKSQIHSSMGKKQKEDEHDTEVRKWWDEYCGSCRREQKALVSGRVNLAFG